MSLKHWENLVLAFDEKVREKPDKPFLWAKKDGAPYAPLTWAQVAAKVASLTTVLKDFGIGPGDRVILVSENRPEWFISDMAIMAAGAITVPAYTTYTSADHLHICENSTAKIAIVSTAKLAQAFLPAAHKCNPLRNAILMEPTTIMQGLHVDIHQWDDLVEDQVASWADVAQAATAIKREDLACLIYTSGTGGSPKGVMIHHGAILHNCEGAYDVLKELKIDAASFLSFLPLSHAYEHSGGQFLPMTIGGEIYYAESIEKLAANMAEARPQIMVVVPRLFEMLRMRITRAVEQEGGLKAKLIPMAIELGVKRDEAPATLTFRDRLLNIVLDLVVRRQVQKSFGGRIKALVSGGAPINPDVSRFFTGLGLPLLQGYGQTEAAPIISVNRPSGPKSHTVGPPIKNTEVQIAEDGEILVRGELVMKGYWGDEEGTRQTIVNGWLHTGDIGMFDEDGHVVITDRKKDIIVLDKGDNVSPQRIEGILTLEPEIAQAMAWGDRRPYLVGVVVPDQDWLTPWARENGKSRNLADLKGDEDLQKAMTAVVTRVNNTLSNLEKVRRIIIATEPFSIENEQLTPTLKIRRHVIGSEYLDAINGLYSG